MCNEYPVNIPRGLEKKFSKREDYLEDIARLIIEDVELFSWDSLPFGYFPVLLYVNVNKASNNTAVVVVSSKSLGTALSDPRNKKIFIVSAKKLIPAVRADCLKDTRFTESIAAFSVAA